MIVVEIVVAISTQGAALGAPRVHRSHRMEGKPYRGTRRGAKNRKKKFYEAQDKLRELLRKLAKRWGVDFVLPRIEYVESACGRDH